MTMKRSTLTILTAGLFLAGTACGPLIMVPPALDLSPLTTVGLIQFSTNAEGGLNRYATQKFLEAISGSQRGARIIELGSEADVLKSAGVEKFGPEAIQAIGAKYGVNALIVGDLNISDIKPKINLALIVKLISAEAEVDAHLTIKLFEVATQATLWTDSARKKENVAQVSFLPGGGAFFDARDPDDAYGELIHWLVQEVTRDLRVSYRRG